MSKLKDILFAVKEKHEEQKDASPFVSAGSSALLKAMTEEKKPAEKQPEEKPEEQQGESGEKGNASEEGKNEGSETE